MPSKIRIAEPSDAADILAIYAPYCESSPVSFEIVAPSVAEMSERVDRILRQYPWLVCDTDGELAGYVYAAQHRLRAAFRWSVDVAVYVSTDHHRRGVGRALYTSLFGILQEQNYFKAYAGITLPNVQSVALHEALGFRPISVYPGAGYKLGRWLDMGWWQLSLRPQIPEPPEPIPFPLVRGSAAVEKAIAAGAELLSGPEVS
jgi:phosphinothricin acetyltransferase